MTQAGPMRDNSGTLGNTQRKSIAKLGGWKPGTTFCFHPGNLSKERPPREAEVREGFLKWCECLDLPVPEFYCRVSQPLRY